MSHEGSITLLISGLKPGDHDSTLVLWQTNSEQTVKRRLRSIRSLSLWAAEGMV